MTRTDVTASPDSVKGTDLTIRKGRGSLQLIMSMVLNF